MSQTILIGANDPNITYLLQRYAEESGFQTAHVCQSQEVLALAFHLQPALILLDVEFVEASGREILRQLKGASATRAIPIVIYSYLDEAPDEWRESVDGYLPKSVLYDDFVAVLKHAIAGRRPKGARVTSSSGEQAP